MKPEPIIARSIPVSALIDILIKYEKKKIKYVDLELIRSDKGDQVIVDKPQHKIKKSKKVKTPLTQEYLEELLKHV